jgi:cell division protein FtsB
MDTTVIIAIIISVIAALGILALVVLLFYYHWRNQELLVNFSAFIRENLKLKDEIDKLEEENEALKEARVS